MSRKVAVFTGTRAEYGLLYWLMKGIAASEVLTLQTIVSAMHLSPEFGATWKQIEADGFLIDAKVEMLLSSDSAVGVVKSMGVGLIGLADALERLHPDVLVVLGDRFEALVAAQAALVMRVPIVHLHGGEITEGAYDDAFRHAITKMASLHFTSCETYRQRVIQMGESPETVFDVGALGLDHLMHETPMDLDAIASSLGFALRKPYFLATYHPVTQGDEDPVQTTTAMLEALDGFPDHQVLLTYPNADNGGRAVIPLLEAYAHNRPGRVLATPSLGFRRYLGALRSAAAMIGNSSSGIIEAPAFGVPTVNIGIRQRGRLSANSVLTCLPDGDSIRQAVSGVIDPSFIGQIDPTTHPYGQGQAALQIVRVLERHDFGAGKRFVDLKEPS